MQSCPWLDHCIKHNLKNGCRLSIDNIQLGQHKLLSLGCLNMLQLSHGIRVKINDNCHTVPVFIVVWRCKYRCSTVINGNQRKVQPHHVLETLRYNNNHVLVTTKWIGMGWQAATWSNRAYSLVHALIEEYLSFRHSDIWLCYVSVTFKAHANTK